MSRATIDRTLRRHGLVTPAPAKRPRSSYIRFQAEQPNETWQADFTHYRLADGADAEILTWLDDHSRYALSVTAHRRVTGPIVVDTFRPPIAQPRRPRLDLTDNGMVFTTRLSGGNGGRNGFETELRRLGIAQKNSRPNHPTTCGKVERFQQTMKKWLRAQPDQPATIAELQAHLDAFVDIYNTRPPPPLPPPPHHPRRRLHRPPQSHPRRPQQRHPLPRPPRPHRQRPAASPCATNGHLHHIGLGRTHAGTRIILLIDDLDVRVIDAATGEILRHLTLDPNRHYQPPADPPDPPPRKPQRPEPR